MDIKFPEKKVILVTGANGQLGQEFRYLAAQQDEYEFLFTHRDTLDISNMADVMLIFQKFRPDYCINCAAYTKVDQAESESELAYLINSKALSNLVHVCQIYSARLIHYSTDYVYDSITGRPISEEDECNPQSLYGKSKRAGEMVLQESNIEWLCLRVSWLYSSYGQNFVKTMLRLGKERSILNVVNDQVGSPTYARDLARSTIEIIRSGDKSAYKKFYNYSNSGTTDWASFAREIHILSGIDCTIKGISTVAYGALAPRPEWSVLSHDKVTKKFNLSIPDWKASLKECLQLLTD